MVYTYIPITTYISVQVRLQVIDLCKLYLANLKYTVLYELRYIFSDDNIGDACHDDNDGDHVVNQLDNCPNDSRIYTTDFR